MLLAQELQGHIVDTRDRLIVLKLPGRHCSHNNGHPCRNYWDKQRGNKVIRRESPYNSEGGRRGELNRSPLKFLKAIWDQWTMDELGIRWTSVSIVLYSFTETWLQEDMTGPQIQNIRFYFLQYMWDILYCTSHFVSHDQVHFILVDLSVSCVQFVVACRFNFS